MEEVEALGGAEDIPWGTHLQLALDLKGKKA
jgi:hypothetical protein